MNIAAGVAAFETFEGQGEDAVTGRNGFTAQRKCCGDVNTARTTHVNFTFFFGVGVDQDISL
ncbi:Uncharacterised protein [Klebsiella pneumoniae]|nr:Uncharacterised protein [Klebsiella pneumoniae]